MTEGPMKLKMNSNLKEVQCTKKKVKYDNTIGLDFTDEAKKFMSDIEENVRNSIIDEIIMKFLRNAPFGMISTYSYIKEKYKDYPNYNTIMTIAKCVFLTIADDYDHVDNEVVTRVMRCHDIIFQKIDYINSKYKFFEVRPKTSQGCCVRESFYINMCEYDFESGHVSRIEGEIDYNLITKRCTMTKNFNIDNYELIDVIDMLRRLNFLSKGEKY